MSSSIAKLLPPLARSSGRHLLSGTVTTARMATGTHLHQIDGYSLVEGSLVAGEFVSSTPFLVGGRWWQLLYYPNGIDSGHRGFVSAELLLAWGEDEKATASYRVSILDHAGLPAHSGAVGPRRFWGRYGRPPSSSSWGKPPAETEELLGKTAIERLVATEELRRSAPLLIRNDLLRVQCDVAVAETKTAASFGSRWFMRMRRDLFS